MKLLKSEFSKTNVASNDGYDCFRQFAEELSLLGREDEARKIYDAMVAGATGAECLGELGEVLARLRKTPHNLPTNSEALVISCIQAIQLAWPHYN